MWISYHFVIWIVPTSSGSSFVSGWITICSVGSTSLCWTWIFFSSHIWHGIWLWVHPTHGWDVPIDFDYLQPVSPTLQLRTLEIAYVSNLRNKYVLRIHKVWSSIPIMLNEDADVKWNYVPPRWLFPPPALSLVQITWYNIDNRWYFCQDKWCCWDVGGNQGHGKLEFGAH